MSEVEQVNENQNIDNDMVSWLYGELDDAASKEFESRLAQDEALRSQAEALKSVSLRFDALESDEPSMGLRGNLLREAAKESASKSVWDRLVGSWVMKPGVFAMATMVLVVGVAGVLHNRGGLEFAEQEMASSQSAGKESRAVRRDDEFSGGSNTVADKASESKGVLGTLNDEPVAEVLDESRQEALERASSVASEKKAETKRKSKLKQSTKKLAKSAPSKKRVRSVSKGGAYAKKPKANSPSDLAADFDSSNVYSPSKSSEFVNSVVGRDEGEASLSSSGRDYAKAPQSAPKSEKSFGAKEGSAQGKSAPKRTKSVPQTPAPPPVAAPVESSDDSDEESYKADSTSKESSKAVRSQEAFRAMEKYAQGAKSCTPVAQMANNLRESDASFYAKNIKGSKSLKRCSKEISAERSRRLSRKSKTKK